MKYFKPLKQIIVVTTMLLASMISSSALAAGGWTGAQKVTLVYPYGSEVAGSKNFVLVRLESQINPDLCDGDFYYSLDSGNNAFDLIFSVLLAAQHGGKKVNLFLSGCSRGVTAGWPKILHVQSVP